MAKVRHATTILPLLEKKPRYVLLSEKNRNKIYRDQKKNRIVKIFKRSLKPSHSEFLITLLSDTKFVSLFCPHLISLIVEAGRVEPEITLVGYIMEEGRVLSRKELVRWLGKPETRKLWLSGMKRWGFYYNDIKVGNHIEGKCVIHDEPKSMSIGLIDLESLRPLPKEPEKRSIIVRDRRSVRNIKRKIELFDLQWYYDAAGIQRF